MSMDKEDVLNQAFRRGFRGYNCSDVDIFMQEVAESISIFTAEKQQLLRRIETLETSLEEHKGREEVLRDTLMNTQKLVDDMKTSANREAQFIVDAANSKAENLLNQTHVRLSQLHGDISELKKQRTQFEVKLKSILDAHLRLLELDKEEQEQLDNAENKIKFIQNSSI